MAELAITFPLMLLMLLVMFDLGQGFLAWVSITNGARDGARVAAQPDTDCVADKVAIKAAATNGASPYTVVVPDPVASGGLCSVTVNYTYNPILPFVTTRWDLVGIGSIGPLWDGQLSETMVSK